ncbi:hypothetical protein DB30_07013 [Enhygromyxa salina]|uniref:Uncharacterized protein n=1 Tax=Enhygromyxa salina TaxID=215803 RepID=A0A0C1Z9M5_9BACT|nr:hypothetical protein DB30_07013 [Enhygromyxa salina]
MPDFSAEFGSQDFDRGLIPTATAVRLGAFARPPGLDLLSDQRLLDRLVEQLAQERAGTDGLLRAYPSIYELAVACHILGEPNPWSELLEVDQPPTVRRWGFFEHYRLAAQLMGWASPFIDPEQGVNGPRWERERFELLAWSLRADRPASADEAAYTIRALLGAGCFGLSHGSSVELSLLAPTLGPDPGPHFDAAAIDPAWIRRRIEGSWLGKVEVQTKSSGRDVVASFRGATIDEAVSGSLVAFAYKLDTAHYWALERGKPWTKILGRPERKIRLVTKVPEGVAFDPDADQLKPYRCAFLSTTALMRRRLLAMRFYDEVVCHFQWVIQEPGRRDRVWVELDMPHE